MFSKKVTIIILSVVLVAGALFTTYKMNIFSSKVDYSLYYAVFLTNGQVYFGNMKDISKKEIVLVDVHYLQLEGGEGTAQSQLAESRFTLIKMGNEIHGPTDELFINRENVLFYETLRGDSKVVDSIKQSKK